MREAHPPRPGNPTEGQGWGTERDRLRAEIDAAVARAYGLTAKDLEVVFADFTASAVPPGYRDLVRAAFRA